MTLPRGRDPSAGILAAAGGERAAARPYNEPAACPACLRMLISRTDDRTATLHELAAPAEAFMACLCAAWCRTCDDFRPAIEAWARQRADVSVVWLDVEDDADLVGDIDVENFPTLLIQRDGAVRFFGPIPPRVSHAERLLTASMAADGMQADDDLPDLHARLLAAYSPP